MATLVLLKYNNYFNRIVKKESALEYYRIYQIGEDIGVNFIPNDYINTTQIINWGKYKEDPDYILVLEDNEIKSRWFVISTTRIREGQLQLELRRDLIVDYYDNILDADCFIEKATINANDPAIYNNEDMTFNEILQSAETLEDNSHCPWLVGYVARNASAFDVDIDYEQDAVVDYSVNSIDELPFAEHINKDFSNFSNIAIDVVFTADLGNAVVFNSFNQWGSVDTPAGISSYPIRPGFGFVTTSTAVSDQQGYAAEMLKCKNRTAVTTKYYDKQLYSNRYFTPYMVNALSADNWADIERAVRIYSYADKVHEISQYVNKVVKMGDKYYRVELDTISNTPGYGAPIESWSFPSVDTFIREAYVRAYNNYKIDYPDMAWGMSAQPSVDPIINAFICTIRRENFSTSRLVLVELTDLKLNGKLTTDVNHVHLSDAPYDMFCMPYSDDLLVVANSGSAATIEIKSSKALALATMNAIARKGVGADAVHDIQLLPYCPLQQYLTSAGKLDLTQVSTLANRKSSYFITDETGVSDIGILIFCDKSSGEFNITKNIPVTDYKIQALCDKYRLCSPNYASIFEFNAAYNRGVEYFNVDFTYKPYSPYIHINPNFKEGSLYGKDLDTPRGLICGGDFSITLISNAWETYQLQNKNYQLSFQRQIENMEVNNAVQKEREVWGVVSGTLGAGVSGAAAGMMATGSPWGALVGLGTAGASVAGGLRDIELNNKLRNEALDYTKDQFGYQLGNIKALPNTIAKVGTFNRNNKIFPVLEYYTCTEMEKQALKDKIRYNGMTIMRVGKIANFIAPDRSYIKAKLIRLESISEDYHIINEIANELYKGVFI